MNHDFGEELGFSHSLSDAPWWEEVYRQAFPDMETMVDLRSDGWHQKAGRDRAVILKNGRAIYIDEKGRRKSYNGGDMLVEVWSVYPKDGRAPYPTPEPGLPSSPGWARKPLDTDYLAYAIVPLKTCYLFPFQGIRAAWEKHCAMWGNKATAEEDGFRWVPAPNNGYNTISIALPLKTFTECINDALAITWSAVAA